MASAASQPIPGSMWELVSGVMAMVACLLGASPLR